MSTDRSERRRTYLRRRGRTTRGQARALAELSERYCLDPDPAAGPIDSAAFGRAAPLGVEIGFGMGQALVQWAEQRPDWNLLGVEIYQPGLGSALLGIEQRALGNVRLVDAAAETVLERRLAPGAVAELRVFFPDPWPKKRHHKRRLINPAFVELAARRLEPGGTLWIATDWEDYAVSMVGVLDAEPCLERERPPNVEAPRTAADAGPRPATRFEARGLRLGHRVWDLRYRRKRSSTESR